MGVTVDLGVQDFGERTSFWRISVQRPQHRAPFFWKTMLVPMLVSFLIFYLVFQDLDETGALW